MPTYNGSKRDKFAWPDMKDVRRRETEQEIARRLRKGETYRSISKAMHVSTKTIVRVNKFLKSKCI